MSQQRVAAGQLDELSFPYLSCELADTEVCSYEEGFLIIDEFFPDPPIPAIG